MNKTKKELHLEIAECIAEGYGDGALAALSHAMFHGAGPGELRGVSDAGVDAETLNAILALPYKLERHTWDRVVDYLADA